LRSPMHLHTLSLLSPQSCKILVFVSYALSKDTSYKILVFQNPIGTSWMPVRYYGTTIKI
jgi:hypothetical protein